MWKMLHALRRGKKLNKKDKKKLFENLLIIGIGAFFIGAMMLDNNGIVYRIAASVALVGGLIAIVAIVYGQLFKEEDWDGSE